MKLFYSLALLLLWIFSDFLVMGKLWTFHGDLDFELDDAIVCGLLGFMTWPFFFVWLVILWFSEKFPARLLRKLKQPIVMMKRRRRNNPKT